MTTHPDVDLDLAFTEAERAAIFESFDDWTVHGQVTLKLTVVSHADALTIGRNRPDNTIVILRSTGDCPFTEPANEHFAVTQPGDAAVICMDADALNARENVWTGVMSHEMGHAFLMQHDTKAPNVLWPGLDSPESRDHLTCEDLKQFAAIWNTYVIGCP